MKNISLSLTLLSRVASKLAEKQRELNDLADLVDNIVDSLAAEERLSIYDYHPAYLNNRKAKHDKGKSRKARSHGRG